MLIWTAAYETADVSYSFATSDENKKLFDQEVARAASEFGVKVSDMTIEAQDQKVWNDAKKIEGDAELAEIASIQTDALAVAQPFGPGDRILWTAVCKDPTTPWRFAHDDYATTIAEALASGLDFGTFKIEPRVFEEWDKECNAIGDAEAKALAAIAGADAVIADMSEILKITAPATSLADVSAILKGGK